MDSTSDFSLLNCRRNFHPFILACPRWWKIPMLPLPAVLTCFLLVPSEMTISFFRLHFHASQPHFPSIQPLLPAQLLQMSPDSPPRPEYLPIQCAKDIPEYLQIFPYIQKILNNQVRYSGLDNYSKLKSLAGHSASRPYGPVGGSSKVRAWQRHELATCAQVFSRCSADSRTL